MTTPLSLLELAALLDSLSENFKLLLFKPGEAEAIAELLRAAQDVIAAANHVWDTVPADFHGPAAALHARALNELHRVLTHYTALRNGKP